MPPFCSGILGMRGSSMSYSFHPRLTSRCRWILVFTVMLGVLLGAVPGALAQASSQKPSTQTPAQKAPTATPSPSPTDAKPPDVLVQLNSALEGLAAKTSLAVVQILVTGYGPLKEEDRSQTALIVRQQALGSGVIVDPSGYIMTNAHVVEGAQRIRVALPIPGDSGRAVPVGKRHILEAKLIGVHKDTDLALLKIDENDLPTLPLLSQQRARVGQLVFA